MSVLVILIPPRPRVATRAAAEAPARAAEFDYVLSTDGQAVVASGRDAPALLPRADSIVAVVADTDVGWQRIAVPKAPAARLRAALAGVMEEALLDDDDALHFALAPQAAAGQQGWVAVLNKPWLASTLAELEAGGRTVDRVVPASAPAAPDAPASGHFFVDGAPDAAPSLVLSDADGVACVRTSGTLARALLPADPGAAPFTATPMAAAAAERWLGAPVALLNDAERALQATRSPWNLRQFDLAPRHRGMVALREGARRFFSAEWRPVRIGLSALVLMQIVGLNVWAWRQTRAIDAKRSEMVELLRATHPGVRAVIDPPAQMRRETELLRAAAGRPGDGDLEVLFGAAAAAWPDGQGPVQTLRFETGRLTLAAPGWGEPQLAQFRERLRPAGYAVELAEGRITLSRASRGAA